MALGGTLSRGSFGRIVYREQSLMVVCGVRPREEIIAQLKVLLMKNESCHARATEGHFLR